MTFADRSLAAILKESVRIRRYCNLFVLRPGKILQSTSINTRGEKKVPFFVANLHHEGVISTYGYLHVSEAELSVEFDDAFKSVELLM